MDDCSVAVAYDLQHFTNVLLGGYCNGRYRSVVTLVHHSKLKLLNKKKFHLSKTIL